MLINIQNYLVGLLFVVMIFICAFDGMIDAKGHDKNFGTSQSDNLDLSYSNVYIRPYRFG